MVAIGRIGPEQAARLFADYLMTRGIPVHLEADGDACVLFATHPDQADTIRAELSEFLAHPDAPRYQAAAWQAGRTKPSGSGHAWDLSHWLGRAGPVTKTIAVIAIAMTLLTAFGDNERMLRYFLISNYPTGLFEIRAGQIYRLLTPIFLHFQIIHILFNLMWLWDLGGVLERRFSGRYLLLLIGLIGIASNLAQYLTAGPYFGGLSGVVYGLLGFIWLRAHFDPDSGLRMPPAVVSLMLGWLVLCFTGLLGPVANAAHLAGLCAGALAGWLSALTRRTHSS